MALEDICKSGFGFLKYPMTECTHADPYNVNEDQLFVIHGLMPKGGFASKIDCNQKGIEPHNCPSLSRDLMNGIEYGTAEHQSHA